VEVNCWAISSVSVGGVDDHVTVIVAAPVAVIRPIQNSRSDPEPSIPWYSFVHVVTPPPVTEVRVAVCWKLRTTKTNRSPTAVGDTGSVLTTLPPPAVASAPTAEIVAVCGTVAISRGGCHGCHTAPGATRPGPNATDAPRYCSVIHGQGGGGVSSRAGSQSSAWSTTE
jgi:mono/diheme cytochrome c family protein